MGQYLHQSRYVYIWEYYVLIYFNNSEFFVKTESDICVCMLVYFMYIHKQSYIYTHKQVYIFLTNIYFFRLIVGFPPSIPFSTPSIALYNEYISSTESQNVGR